MDNNGFGLMHVWTQGDWVTRCVFAALVLMSVASWIVIVIKALGVVRAKGRRRASKASGTRRTWPRACPSCCLSRCLLR